MCRSYLDAFILEKNTICLQFFIQSPIRSIEQPQSTAWLKARQVNSLVCLRDECESARVRRVCVPFNINAYNVTTRAVASLLIGFRRLLCVQAKYARSVCLCLSWSVVLSCDSVSYANVPRSQVTSGLLQAAMHSSSVIPNPHLLLLIFVSLTCVAAKDPPEKKPTAKAPFPKEVLVSTILVS